MVHGSVGSVGTHVSYVLLNVHLSLEHDAPPGAHDLNNEHVNKCEVDDLAGS